jgi:phage I-like protein
LAEENQRLAQDALRLGEENRALRAIQRQREVRYFLAELRGTGQLTPALERAGVEQALLAADEQPLSVTLPDGSAVPLSALLRELLKALPVSFTYGEAAPSAAPAAPALSADDQAVMAALGLSAEEYAVDSMR